MYKKFNTEDLQRISYIAKVYASCKTRDQVDITDRWVRSLVDKWSERHTSGLSKIRDFEIIIANNAYMNAISEKLSKYFQK